MTLPPEDDLQTTVLFHRSSADGTLRPAYSVEGDPDHSAVFSIGATIADRYRLTKHLGTGGMGRVFLATDLSLDRRVAVKVVSHRHHDTRQLESVLRREARLGANLSHRGIAAVYDFGMEQNSSFTVFEYIEGQTLRAVMRNRVTFPLDEASQIISDLASALDHAHLNGVIHRDLKPENVCLTKAGECKLLDLGLARDVHAAVVAGEYSGTPAYSSPEQARCEHTDARTDQYALALIAFELLTGKRAFAADHAEALLKKHIEVPPPPARDFLPDLPRYADRAIQRALSKQAEDRFSSCTEFAEALRGGLQSPTARHNVSTLAAQRLGFYIAHAAEDSLLARCISDELQQAEYSSWYYGRDALPGVPFTNQARQAIERAQAMVLILSHAAIQLADFEREIEHAYHIGSPILPILVDVTREQFEKLAPHWLYMLGASGMIEYRRSEAVPAVMERILAAAETLHIGTDGSVPHPRPASIRQCVGQIWATDANQIDILETERVLFRTDAINDFLFSKHRHFISAPKGFGKTLLLTRKRALLSEQGSDPVTMVPEGRPYLDFMSEIRTLSGNHQSRLSNLADAKRSWAAALRISAISHFPSVIEQDEEFETAQFPPRVRRWLRGHRIQPSLVFKELTSLSVSELNRLVDSTETFLDQKMRQIHSGLIIFIDKVDQAISHLSRDAWIAIQAGLIEAAWETMNANSHVKIFASIRQEAFANYQSHVKANLFAATTNLSYTETELRALLDQLAECYEGCQSFVDFLGHNVLRHGRRPVPEDSFHYVRRHTLGRPRDIVALASGVSSQRQTLSEKGLREIVQQISSDVLAANVFDEVRVFLSCLDQSASRGRFFAALPGNILDKADACRVCEDFNGLEPGSLQHFGEESSEIFHPFRDLYFAGLLGIVVHDTSEGVSLQRFRRPQDSWTDTAAHIPDSGFYLLHPALDTFIRQQRSQGSFLQHQHVSVGDNELWRPFFPTLVQIEKQLHQLNDLEFVETAHRFVKRVQSLFSADKSTLTLLELENSPLWKSLAEYSERPEYSDALLWLGELLEELRVW
jgi:hypothetical protein